MLKISLCYISIYGSFWDHGQGLKVNLCIGVEGVWVFSVHVKVVFCLNGD